METSMLLGGLGVYNIGVSITATIMVQTIIKFKRLFNTSTKVWKCRNIKSAYYT